MAYRLLCILPVAFGPCTSGIFSYPEVKVAAMIGIGAAFFRLYLPNF
jgi:hypothetical protein